MLVGAALAALYGGILGACKKDYDVTPTEPAHTASPANTPIPTIDDMVTVTPVPDPTATPSPTATAAPEPTATPAINPTPTLETKLFDFVFPDSTPEQYKTFSANALEDYRAVLGIYGIKEENARLKVMVAKNESYSFNFYFDNKSGTHGWTGFDSFTTNRAKFRHEVTHAINNTLFPTKNQDDPWYNTFQEGSAKYASGEVEAAKPTSTLLREDDGSLKDYNWIKAIDYLISNPNKFWDRETFEVSPFSSPGHLTGQVLYLLLDREGLTPEKHTVALQKLAEYYKQLGAKTNKEMIQSVYEFALGRDLNHLFTLLEPGIKRYYVTPTPIAPR